MNEISYPRHVPFRGNSEIHVCGDTASDMGQAWLHTFQYFWRKKDGYELQTLFAKSKINSIRDLTVPRLELMTALLSAQTDERCTEIWG